MQHIPIHMQTSARAGGGPVYVFQKHAYIYICTTTKIHMCNVCTLKRISCASTHLNVPDDFDQGLAESRAQYADGSLQR